MSASFGFWQPAWAQAPTIEQLSQYSIEDLANIQVISVSRRPEPLSGAAAAIYVITADDIRRSGATSLPEALRLAPNLQVARINGFTHTVTARGFNSPESANKLLVLIDGRSVYSPVASTVFWQGINVPLADVERIEVISGPGGTLYGANAVNGVINVITRSSSDTKGVLVNGGAGSEDQSATLRYGGELPGVGAFRFYGTAAHRNNTLPVSPTDTTKDAVTALQGGFRLDGALDQDSFTVQGDIYSDRVEGKLENLWGGNLLARWAHPFENGANLTVQAYWDKNDRDAVFIKDRLDTFDLQAQSNFSLGETHQLVVGGEYRVWREGFFSISPLRFEKPEATLSVSNIFAQDEIAIADGLRLIAGLKLEESSYSGLNALPNVRLAWQVAPKHLLWAAASRAVRTPSRIDRELAAPGFFLPAPNFKTETLIAYEAGYRGELLPKLLLSVSGFYNTYDDLRSDQTTPVTILPIQFQNHLQADTYGVEIWADYDVTDWWRLRAGFNSLRKDLRLDPGASNLAIIQSSGQDPPYQSQLRSEMTIAEDWELDIAVRNVGHITSPFTPSIQVLVPSYTEADIRIGWHVTNSLELSIDGFNLLHDHHLEFFDPSSYPPRYMQRSVFMNVRKTF